MLITQETVQFTREVRLLKRRGEALAKLWDIVEILENEAPLPRNKRMHRLTGNWAGCYECHVDPDWILIWEVDGESLILHRTGSHSDIFGK